MKKVIFSILLMISIIAITQAQVLITPNPYSISSKVGENLSFQITISNTNNFTISDFDFGNLTSMGFLFGNTTVSPNSNKTIDANVNPTSAFSGDINQIIGYKFHANIPLEVTTYNIGIGPYGFSNNYQIIREGDTVTWTNNDSVIHNVFSSLFNQDINPNESFSYTFTDKGVYDYVDSTYNAFSSFHGIIEVINRTEQELVHNPSNDFYWNLSIDFFLNPTNITLDVLDNNFTVGATSQTEGSLRVKNIGSVVADKINLSSSSSWVTFEENKFDLQPNSQNYVTFRVIPALFKTEDTNKTYNITITAKGTNSETITKTIQVFIPYSQVFSDVTTDAGFLTWFSDVYCPAHPNLFICNPNQTVVVQGNGTGNQSLNLTVSSLDLYNYLRDQSLQSTSFIRFTNDLNQLKNDYAEYLTNINETSSQALEQSKNNNSSLNTAISTISIILFFMVLISCIIFISYQIRKKNKLKDISEGQYQYNYY